jgi:hypothetical protein
MHTGDTYAVHGHAFTCHGVLVASVRVGRVGVVVLEGAIVPLSPFVFVGVLVGVRAPSPPPSSPHFTSLLVVGVGQGCGFWVHASWGCIDGWGVRALRGRSCVCVCAVWWALCALCLSVLCYGRFPSMLCVSASIPGVPVPAFHGRLFCFPMTFFVPMFVVGVLWGAEWGLVPYTPRYCLPSVRALQLSRAPSSLMCVGSCVW